MKIIIELNAIGVVLSRLYICLANGSDNRPGIHDLVDDSLFIGSGRIKVLIVHCLHPDNRHCYGLCRPF